MKRVMIIGGGGAGKSTLARLIGDAVDLPVIHIDPMYWNSGWVQRPREETRELALEAAQKDKWVFDGNNSATMQERLDRADTVIFLDVGTLTRLWRITKRTLRYYGRSRPDMAEGCPERFNWEFIRFVAGYAKDGRLRALEFLSNVPNDKCIYHLRNNRDIRLFLSNIKSLQ